MEIGTVRWFNDAKGYGFIITAQGVDVLVHHTVIQMENYRTLSQGQVVQYEAITHNGKLRATVCIPGAQPQRKEGTE